MQESGTKEPELRDPTAVSKPPTVTRSSTQAVGKSGSKRRAHNALSLEQLKNRAAGLSVPGLRIFSDTVRKKGNGYFYVMTECDLCGVRREKELRNMEKKLSSKCQCAGASKFPGVPLAVSRSLGTRYSAMRQRCERDSHVSSHHYKGRGIKVEFSSRREFVLWALATFPGQDFKGMDFDRIDNDGHYAKENLRLVPRSRNLLNRRITQSVNIGHARRFLAAHPEVTYTERTVLGLLMKYGNDAEAILEHHRNSSRALGWRKKARSAGSMTSTTPGLETGSSVRAS